MSADEIGRTTPREWNELMSRWRERQEREDRRAALVACVIANCLRDHRSEAMSIEDFMPTNKKEEPKRRMTDEEMLKMVVLANKALGGVVI